jgi:hypothetical protein
MSPENKIENNEKMPIWMLLMWVIGLVGIVIYFLSSLGRNPF